MRVFEENAMQRVYRVRDADERLTSVKGVGNKTARNLIGVFKDVESVLDAVLLAPEWVEQNITGIGPSTMDNLEQLAHDSGAGGEVPRAENLRYVDKETTYFCLGKRPDGLFLFATGEYQDDEQIKVDGRSGENKNSANWGVYSPSTDRVILLNGIDLEKTPLNEVIQNHDWDRLTDMGHTLYSYGSDFGIDEYPATYGDYSLVGVLKSNLAVYVHQEYALTLRLARTPIGTYTSITDDIPMDATDIARSLDRYGNVGQLVAECSSNNWWKEITARWQAEELTQ